MRILIKCNGETCFSGEWHLYQESCVRLEDSTPVYTRPDSQNIMLTHMLRKILHLSYRRRVEPDAAVERIPSQHPAPKVS